MKKIYGGSCVVIVRSDNGYPLQVFGYDRKDEAERIAKINGEKIIVCIAKEKHER
jgi:hypothetical protein